MNRLPILATLGMAIAACAPPPGPKPPEGDVRAAADSINAFAFDLYANLAGAREGNLVFSPASVSTVLAMAAAGARGRTADEMRKTLRFDLEDKTLHPAMGGLAALLAKENPGSRVSVANSLWIRKGRAVLPAFSSLCGECYAAGPQEADFKGAPEPARAAINRWVEEKTRDRIKNLLPPGSLGPDTELVLANAVYFLGTWKTLFDQERTIKEPFHVGKDRTVQADMMRIADKDFRYFGDDGLQALEMSYRGDEASMVVLLPAPGRTLAEFEKGLSRDALSKWLSRLETKEVDLLVLPRFRMTCPCDLGGTLAAMGMSSAFGPGADFSGMTGEKGIFIGRIAHKAFIEVNERGTEAAAATAVPCPAKAAPFRKPIIFRADRPFVFLIRDLKTGAILFIGRVADPTAGGV